MRTYYISWSSWFDTHKYDPKKMAKAILKVGGKQPMPTSQYGWPNMPDVVVFKSTPACLERIQKELEKVLHTEWIIIKEVNWPFYKKVKAF